MTGNAPKANLATLQHFVGSSLYIQKLRKTIMQEDLSSDAFAEFAISDEMPIDLKQRLAETEVALIRQALANCKGVVSHTAKHLSIGRTTLIEKMRKHELGGAYEAVN